MIWTKMNWPSFDPATHEQAERQWVVMNVPTGGVFVDVGADVGTWSVNLSDHFDKVYAIEPSAEDISALVENIRLNNLRDKIEWRLVAASDKEGLVYLSSRSMDTVPNWFVSTAQPTWDKWEVVDSITLDSLGLSPRLVKIDVEGWGGEVLDGAVETLKRTDYLVFELHNEKEQSYFKALKKGGWEMLHESGGIRFLRRIK